MLLTLYKACFSSNSKGLLVNISFYNLSQVCKPERNKYVQMYIMCYLNMYTRLSSSFNSMAYCMFSPTLKGTHAFSCLLSHTVVLLLLSSPTTPSVGEKQAHQPRAPEPCCIYSFLVLCTFNTLEVCAGYMVNN